jgi:hypothetical protein
VTSLRLETDFGNYLDPVFTSTGRDAIPERFQLDTVRDGNLLHVLYAYVGVKNLAGCLDVRLGRQLRGDPNDFLAYDGLEVVVRTPWFVALEAFGGVLADSEWPLAAPIYLLDGTSQVDARREGELAWGRDTPTFGAAAETVGLRFVDARVSYRQSLRGTSDDLVAFVRTRSGAGVPGTTTVDEKLSFSLRGTLFGGAVAPFVGIRYNLVQALADQVQAGLRVELSRSQSVAVDYLRAVPTFDGDSIFNVFGAEPFNDVRATYNLAPAALWLGGRVRGYVMGFARLFRSDDLTSAAGRRSGELGAVLGGRWERERVTLRADLYSQWGYGGDRTGADAVGVYRVAKTPLSLEARATLLYVGLPDDGVRYAATEVVSGGVAGGGRLLLAQGVSVHLLAEENVNRFYRSQTRVMAVLELGLQR